MTTELVRPNHVYCSFLRFLAWLLFQVVGSYFEADHEAGVRRFGHSRSEVRLAAKRDSSGLNPERAAVSSEVRVRGRSSR